MIPEGKFRAKALRAALCETSGGKEQMAIHLQFTEGELVGQRIEYDGFFGSEKQVEFTVNALRACGWKGDDLANIGALGEEVEVVVKHEEYNGKTYAKAKYINSLSESSRKSMDAARARSFADRMKARVRAVGAEHGRDEPRPQRSERPEPPPYDDNEIPF